MSIEIIELTKSGWDLSHSVRNNNSDGWRVVYHLSRVGGRTTVDRITNFCFSGDRGRAVSTINKLKNQGIIAGG